MSGGRREGGGREEGGGRREEKSEQQWMEERGKRERQRESCTNIRRGRGKEGSCEGRGERIDDSNQVSCSPLLPHLPP